MNIYASDIVVEVGSYVTIPRISDSEGVIHYGVRAYVIREATQEEYCAQSPLMNPAYAIKFYELSLD